MKNFYFIIILTGLAISFSCRKDTILTDSSAKLSFSEDTVIFDTVFTTIGSSTQFLKVYNRNKRTVNISEIRLAGGSGSNFRINIDGLPVTKEENIELKAEDSLWIFIEVTVDPNGSNSPLIITDSILFSINGNLQDVDLVAWGQDANYYLPNQYIYGFPPFYVLDCNTNWTNTKPYVVYGYLFVDSACTLTIDAGSQVHFHKNSGLWIYRNGALIVNGQKDNEVVFQGDRLEFSYEEIPGQWDRIWINESNTNSKIEYAIIKNGFIGIQAETWPLDPTVDSAQNTLTINNTIVRNMSGVGIYGRNYNITGENMVVANCGSYVAALSGGGNYDFTHCSFANYWNYGTRDNPLLFISNYYEDLFGDTYIKTLSKASFTNCIIYGNHSKGAELGLEKHATAAMNYVFDHCLIRTDLSTSDGTKFINIVKNPPQVTIDGQLHDPVFNDFSKGDYHLFNQSAAINMGNTTTSGNMDLEGITRDASPDIGAYEFMP